jgi:hypothetical protein
MQAAVLGPVDRMNVYYQIDVGQKPVVYVRCDPRTYEVFAVEQHYLLPACPELGSDLKIGRAANLQNREQTFRENGVFVFFVSLECTDDSTLLENTLKEMFQAQRSSTGTEYYDLRNLKALFEEQDARGVLEKMKERIRAVIAGLVFLFTLQVTIYTANDVYGNRGDISVTFTREVMPVEGRKNDQVYQTMISENMVLAEENQVLGKRAREQEEVLARRADRIAELERANEALERDNEEMRKRLKLANEVVVLQP